MAYCKCKPGFMGQTCTAMYRDCRGVVCYNGAGHAARRGPAGPCHAWRSAHGACAV